MYETNENNTEKGMLYPTIDELTQGKYNRYQLAIGTARGARMLTNEYVKQRVVAEKLQSIQKEAGNKEGEKPISAMVDAEYRDEKAVKLAIKRLYDGEFKMVEKDASEIADIDEEFAKEISAELAKLAKQRDMLRKGRDDEFGDDAEDFDVAEADYDVDPDEIEPADDKDPEEE